MSFLQRPLVHVNDSTVSSSGRGVKGGTGRAPCIGAALKHRPRTVRCVATRNPRLRGGLAAPRVVSIGASVGECAPHSNGEFSWTKKNTSFSFLKASRARRVLRPPRASTEDGAVKEVAGDSDTEPEPGGGGENAGGDQRLTDADGANAGADSNESSDDDEGNAASSTKTSENAESDPAPRPVPPRRTKMSRKQKKAAGKAAAKAAAKEADSMSPPSEDAAETAARRVADSLSNTKMLANRRKHPRKGVDLLLPVDYLSPALAQKMARNGHLSALQRVASNVLGTDASSDQKNVEAVLYGSSAQAETGVKGVDLLGVTHDFAYAKTPTPVFVMLPLDVVSRDGALQHKRALETSLMALKKIGVEGVMIDVWWGIVERDGPGLYDWTAYLELLDLVEHAGLKLNAVMSFHACGANVGDYFKVSLPKWVLDAASEDPDLFFTDQYGYRNPECISLWADNAMTLGGRTPLQCYADFMRSFRDAVSDEGLFGVLAEVSVGCGPCGELRYPAYPENKVSPNSSQWQFPGIGEFQCYDQRALGNLARAGSEAGHIEWGGAGPHDAGGYNNLPHETGFFTAHEGSWDSEYGQFFLSWYAGELVEHGDRMLRCARNVFERDDDATGLNISEGIGEGISEGNSSTGTFSKKGKKAAVGTFVTTVGTADTQNTEKKHVPALAIKCAGVHWWYNSRSHAAELTAGYFNTRSGDRAPERDGYEPIVAICGVHGARLNFTCAEMRDVEHPFFSRCGPEGLLRQIRAAAARYGVKVAGENALCRFDQDAYEKIITNCRGEGEDAALWATGTLLPPMASFTFLRLSKELFEDDNFRSFVRFVARMANETGTALVDEAHAVQADEVFKSLFSEETDADGNSDTLRPGGLRDIRDETSSGYVTTGSTETERG